MFVEGPGIRRHGHQAPPGTPCMASCLEILQVALLLEWAAARRFEPDVMAGKVDRLSVLQLAALQPQPACYQLLYGRRQPPCCSRGPGQASADGSPSSFPPIISHCHACPCALSPDRLHGCGCSPASPVADLAPCPCRHLQRPPAGPQAESLTLCSCARLWLPGSLDPG